MFDIIGSIIGVLIVFNTGVYIGGKYYDAYVGFVKNLIAKFKTVFQRKKQ